MTQELSEIPSQDLPPPSTPLVLGVPAPQGSSIAPTVIQDDPSGARVSTGAPVPVAQGKNISARRSRCGAFKHRLKPTQEAFIKHYTDPTSPTFGNGTEAYLQSHPTCGSRQAAGVRAYETVRNRHVHAAIIEQAKQLKFGKDEAIEGLVWNIQTSQDQGKLADHREGTKVYLQATGNWKEVQEITHLEDAQKDAIRRTVSEALRSN